MKIVIEHHRVKRELNGNGFNICGSREDLIAISDQLREKATDTFAYGWVQIRDPNPDEHFTGPNSQPWPWS
jgi:hypothetical protein